MERYKVLLPTSGTGSRLKEITKNTNKALVEVAGRPAVSYIIDAYPEETEFIITVGYLGEQIREAFPRLYPGRKFTFVEVDTYEGPGSSLGYSMLKTEEYLQEPFIFHSCDTLIFDKAILPPDKNWIVGYEMEGDIMQYRTIQADPNNIITRINDKGEGTSKSVLIGLFGIKDYESYWKTLNELYKENPLDETLNDTTPFNRLIEGGLNILLVPFPTWLDTGNPVALEHTERTLFDKNND